VKIVFVRHPPTPWTGVRYVGQRDLGWSRLGSQRAYELVSDLRSRLDGRARIISSPLRRARALAERLATATGWDLEVDARWAEVDVGEYEGATFAEIAARDPAFAHALSIGDLHVDWPGGEPGEAFGSRVVAAFEGLVRDDVNVVVSHAGPIALVLEQVYGPGSTSRFLGAGEGIVLVGDRASGWSQQPLRSYER